MPALALPPDKRSRCAQRKVQRTLAEGVCGGCCQVQPTRKPNSYRGSSIGSSRARGSSPGQANRGGFASTAQPPAMSSSPARRRGATPPSAARQPMPSIDAISTLFSAIDKDGNGVITRAELAAALQSHAAKMGAGAPPAASPATQPASYGARTQPRGLAPLQPARDRRGGGSYRAPDRGDGYGSRRSRTPPGARPTTSTSSGVLPAGQPPPPSGAPPPSSAIAVPDLYIAAALGRVDEVSISRDQNRSSD
jgi:hypothetical protein